jgi:hypothetical protein
VAVAENRSDPGFQLDDPSLTEGGAAASGDTPQCQTESRAAEAIGLDMYVMLDSSGSMNGQVTSRTLSAFSPFPPTKWDAVRASLRAFVDAPETAGIGVGLQFFPQIQEGVPLTCETSAECGAAGGTCTSSVCVRTAIERQIGPNARYISAVDDTVPPCLDDSECPGTESCRPITGLCVLLPGEVAGIPEGTPLPLGVPAFCGSDADCAGLPQTVCEPLGICTELINGQPQPCTGTFTCAAGAGQCNLPTFGCTGQTRCDVADYSTPAVPITSDATRTTVIRSALANRIPSGLTPTGPALQGALEQAQVWAQNHPERQVVTVLATDGFPEGFCTPDAIPDIAAIARAANTGAQPIRTFVIGVFAAADLAQGRRQDLDQIASAGGSQQAIVINTAGDVTQDFLQALNRIRDTSVSCEFQLTGTGLDFDKVNLEVRDGLGSTPLVNVGDASACGTDEQGWFYDRDAAGSPTQITVCPSTCQRFMVGGVTANLQIGCATRIR